MVVIMSYDFFTVEEVADLLKINKMTVYRYIKAGKIKAVKIGNDYRINKNEFAHFIESNKTK